ncbi:hypothetical protein MAR_019557 [Mya arenaria]|uniref:Uncharacterized protein n=1 Tax=Mya arenaria TaxID=6604 RepID=A0ABY7E2G4_MYAAR|nr:hypothetical protein MAR_019557 [Mya arenaria]
MLSIYTVHVLVSVYNVQGLVSIYDVHSLFLPYKSFMKHHSSRPYKEALLHIYGPLVEDLFSLNLYLGKETKYEPKTIDGNKYIITPNRTTFLNRFVADVNQWSKQSETLRDKNTPFVQSYFVYADVAEVGSQRAPVVLRCGQITRDYTDCCSLTNALRVAYLEEDGWQIVFRATAGNGQSVYDAWTNGTSTISVKPVDITRANSSHYMRKNLRSNWERYNIKYVKMAVYKDNREAAYVIFNGEGSTADDWFSPNNVVDSSWVDLMSSETHNFFSILGADDGRVLRRFFINTLYRGCPGDIGHFAVIEEGVCSFDKHARFPQFIYSNQNGADFWQNRFAVVDYFCIFISTA